MKRPEQQLQQEIVRYFSYQYPKLKGLLCANLNNAKDARTGGIYKSMGVISGRSDMVLYFNGNAIHIELKSLKGKQSANQKSWQKTIENQGFKYVVIYSLDEFIELVKEVLYLPKKLKE